ncbi:MAG: hypothetical protein ACJAU6_004119 [Alphaproteobacteria bacterium]|jgi:hypothetical protein
MRKSIGSLVVCLCTAIAFTIPSVSHATLIETDLSTSGDKLITSDTVSGLPTLEGGAMLGRHNEEVYARLLDLDSASLVELKKRGVI